MSIALMQSSQNGKLWDNGKKVDAKKVIGKNEKIFVIGRLRVKTEVVNKIGKEMGLEPQQIVIEDDYDKNKHLNIDFLKGNHHFAGVLVGPVPHHSIGSGNYSSIVSRISREEGFPPSILLNEISGGLKITKTSFENGLHFLINKIKNERGA